MKARIGIMQNELIQKHMLAIVSGKYQRAPDEPKIWFTSLNALGQILNPENIALLRLIAEHQPETITELAALSNRQLSNLSVTLQTLNGYGFVDLIKTGRKVTPKALFTDFEIIVDSAMEARILAS
ncbi:transcriptional regulator [Buttiauxella selenatireducens]|uniref:Transcriptional regulator n=1 Tax=Buttiauxella selenatireducens TaxID=3073902 RepID=A0ABY9SGC3_9ENTR|nr:transcriptional regulator [Buttiauxella sp. R73]WMY76540.1 transcriptional regulator [Buttiauxella sp. R73]